MSVVINTNFAAIVAANNLASSNESLQRSLNRLSTGSKIVNPSDDAGGLAVSMKLAAAARRQGAVSSNLANAVSFLQTQEGSLSVTAKILDRISELRTLNDDVTKSANDKANYNTEFTALQAQMQAIYKEEFNAVPLFGDTAAGAMTVFTSEAGGGATDSEISLTQAYLSGTTDGVGLVSNATSLGSLSLTTITDALQHVATMRAENGAKQSQLGFASELVTVNKANLEAANSRIVDVDVADESTQLARWNVLVQSGTAMLAQANQSAQIALKLLS